MAKDEPETISVYAWPKGKPLPPNARDGMADFLEGDDEFEHAPDAQYWPSDVPRPSR